MIYRAKTTFNSLGSQSYTATIDGQPVTKQVIVLPACDNMIICKYLDGDGLFRFYPFSARYTDKLDIKRIGNVIDYESNTQKSIGSNATRIIVANAYIEEQFISVVKWLFVSPTIELLIDGVWASATIADGNYVIRKGKGGSIIVDVQFNLSEYQTIKR